MLFNFHYKGHGLVYLDSMHFLNFESKYTENGHLSNDDGQGISEKS